MICTKEEMMANYVIFFFNFLKQRESSSCVWGCFFACIFGCLFSAAGNKGRIVPSAQFFGVKLLMPNGGWEKAFLGSLLDPTWF